MQRFLPRWRWPGFVAGMMTASLSLLSVPSLYSADGTEAASFLQIPVGAGPASLGSAYTALAKNSYATVWNPAGLAFLPSMELSGQHLSYLESINYEYAGFAIPLNENAGFGVAAQYLGSGDIAGRGPSGTSTGDFSVRYGAYSLGYGQKLSSNWSLGASFKFIEAKISDVSANAVAFDIGALYQATNDLDFALTVVNMGNKLRFLNEGNSLPLAVHMGAAYRLGSRWMISTEGVIEKNESAHGRVGVSWQPIDNLALRVGYRSDSLKELSALAGLSTGMGVKVFGTELAYAWVPYGDLGTTHYFSIAIPFKTK